MFNNKKIKELEGDIKTLYTLYESLERRIKSNGIFESFCTNRNEILLQNQMNCQISQQQGLYSLDGLAQVATPHSAQPEYKDITVKSVVGLILKKMGLKVGYIPEREKRFIPAGFKLIKRE